MKLFAKMAVALGLAVLPAGAVAQAAAGGGRNAGSAGQINARHGAPPSLGTETLQGVVQGVNYQTGVIGLRVGNVLQELLANPNQIAELIPGEQVTIQYEFFGPNKWITGIIPGATGAPYAEQGELRGVVAGVNKMTGVLVVQAGPVTQTFRANPAGLVNLLPGQFVEVPFERIGGEYWATQVLVAGRPAGPLAAGQPGGGAGAP